MVALSAFNLYFFWNSDIQNLTFTTVNPFYKSVSQFSTTDLVDILAVKVGQNVVSSEEERKPLLTYFWFYKMYQKEVLFLTACLT